MNNVPSAGAAAGRDELVGTLRAAGCVFAEDEADLLLEAATSPADLAGMVERRVAGTPLEVIVGWVEFAGLRIAVDPGVFVPRQRTRFLLEAALARTRPDAVVVDLCCGCGAIGLAIKHARPDVELHAAELEPAAVANARRTLAGLARTGPLGTVHAGDLFSALPAGLAGRIDVLVANAPYVPTAAVALMPPEAREHEALIALDGGADGLAVIRRLIAGSPEWLAPQGFLLFETDESQAPAALSDVRAAGLQGSAETSDDYGATVVVGARPAGSRATGFSPGA